MRERDDDPFNPPKPVKLPTLINYRVPVALGPGGAAMAAVGLLLHFGPDVWAGVVALLATSAIGFWNAFASFRRVSIRGALAAERNRFRSHVRELEDDMASWRVDDLGRWDADRMLPPVRERDLATEPWGTRSAPHRTSHTRFCEHFRQIHFFATDGTYQFTACAYCGAKVPPKGNPYPPDPMLENRRA